MITSLLMCMSMAIPDDAVVALIMVDRFADGADNGVDVDKTNIRAFHGGDLTGLKQRLPYLKELGVTHLWLTPLHQQIDHSVGEGREKTAPYHGYWPAKLDAVDPHFGTLQQLKEVVVDANGLGMGVVLDVVVNHLGYGAPDPDGVVRKRCGSDEVTTCIYGLPDLETEDARVTSWIVAKTAWWAINVPGLAGVRLDAAKHIHEDTTIAIRSALRAEEPGLDVIVEHWGAKPGDVVIELAFQTGQADAAYDFDFRDLVTSWIAGTRPSEQLAYDLLARDAILRQSQGGYVSFLDSHDVETWTHFAKDRALIGGVLLLSSRSIPALTWGTELAREGGANDPANRTDMPWEVAAAPPAASSTWRALIDVRRRHDFVWSGVLHARGFDRAPTPRFLVLQRDGPRERAVIAMSREQALRHAEPARGERIGEVIAHKGTAKIEAGQLVVDVEEGGVVVVVLVPSA